MWGNFRFADAIQKEKVPLNPLPPKAKNRGYDIPISLSGSLLTPLVILTDELLVNIFSYLTSYELCIVERVNKHFRKLSNNDRLWKELCESDFHSFMDNKSTLGHKHWYKISYDGEKLAIKHSSIKVDKYKKESKGPTCCLFAEEVDPQDNGPLRIKASVPEDNDEKFKLKEGVKLVMLGDSGIGKTTVLLRLHKKQFFPQHNATIGTTFIVEQLIIEDTPVKFHIWDTAGSERYNALVPMYYRGAVAAIVMYCITSLDTFDRAKGWINELIREVEPRPVIALVGNKADLNEQRQVTYQMAEEYAQERNLLFTETSAKTGQNVMELFLMIASELIRKAEG